MYKQLSKRALLLFHDLRVTRLVVKKIAILHVKDQHMYVRTYVRTMLVYDTSVQ